MIADNSSLLNRLFKMAVDAHASDLHLAVGQPPIVRVKEVLQPLPGEQPVTQQDLLAEFKKMLSPPVYTEFELRNDKDLSYELPTGERFRVNIYWKFGQPAMAARLIPAIIPSLDELEAPEACMKFVSMSQGIVLVTGPTGAGKSTLLASMIEYINQNRTKHVLTLEDPIEFVYKPKQCLISQRELGNDFPTFADGLKHVFRQDPDIILIGEMRDPETIGTALTLAETGHLVFATLHTNGAAQSVERIINTFPPTQQSQVRLQLSLVLRGVISQLLLKNVEGGLTPVHEVMTMTHAVANTIRDGRTEQLQNVIFTSSGELMADLDQELQILLEQNIITRETAQEVARNPKNFM